MPLAGKFFGSTAALAIKSQLLEIFEVRHEAGGENRQTFLRISEVAFGGINQLAAGTIGKLHLRGGTSREWQAPRPRREGLRRNPHRPRLEEKTEIIEKMTGLAQNPPTAFLMTRKPM